MSGAERLKAESIMLRPIESTELDGGGVSERAGGSNNVHEVGEIQKGKVVDGLEGLQKDFEVNSEIDQEPVYLL